MQDSPIYAFFLAFHTLRPSTSLSFGLILMNHILLDQFWLQRETVNTGFGNFAVTD